MSIYKTLKRFFLIFLFLPLAAEAQERNSTVVFRNVTLIDMRSEQPKPNMTVVVSGTRISKIGKNIKIPKNAQIIDASGKYLIPGLWDMHAHAVNIRHESWFPMLIANGVTGIRDLGSPLPLEKINEIRGAVSDGKILGPRIGAVAGRIVNGVGGDASHEIVSTPEEGRQLVRRYKQQGADFIKPYNLLAQETYLAILDEAKRQKMPVEGHVPFSMTAEETSDLGQIIIEHNFGVLLSASRAEDELRKASQTEPNRWASFEAKAAVAFDEQKAKTLFARFVRNGTWSCPTIIAYRQLLYFDNESIFLNDDRMKYIPQPVRERWHTAFVQRSQINMNADNKTRWKMRSRIVGMMHRMGVRLLAGTDMADLYIIPGFSLHDELQLMVEAGLSPLTALQTATINPAKFLGKEKEFGTIEKGQFADLILLDANPLADISNTKKINAVVVNGRLLDRKTLDKLLTDVEAATSKK